MTDKEMVDRFASMGWVGLLLVVGGVWWLAGFGWALVALGAVVLGVGVVGLVLAFGRKGAAR